MLMPKRTKYRKPHRISYEGKAKGNTKITNPVDLYIFEAWLEFKNNGGKAKGIPDLIEYYEYEESKKKEAGMTMRLTKHEQNN